MHKPKPIFERDLEMLYREFLDEYYGEVEICGYKYESSSALRVVDPVAYRCGFADWISAELDERLIEVDGEYFVREDFEEYLENLKEENEEIENG